MIKLTTPPMGWNTWNTFGRDINEELVKTTADALVSTGLKDAGYEYLIIDDCWSKKERDENGRLQADPEKFPSGMKALAAYVHSKGLKFGMYSCCGTETCSGYPGSFGFENIDAETFASWDVDYLKYDHCYKPESAPSELLYRKMGLALSQCGRDILYAACSWGTNKTPEWIKSTGADTWRSTGDIHDCASSILDIYNQNIDLQKYNTQGCFNDMDMLVIGMHGKGLVGMGGCTEEEYRLHMSVWAMFASPLIIGCDIRNMDDETKNILLNKDVIAINQDPACRQPFRIGYDSWVRYLDNGDIAVLIVNPGETERWVIYAELPDLGITLETGKKLLVRDLWTKEEFIVSNSSSEHSLSGRFAPHTSRMFRCKVID